jgi:hypothetical protein
MEEPTKTLKANMNVWRETNGVDFSFTYGGISLSAGLKPEFIEGGREIVRNFGRTNNLFESAYVGGMNYEEYAQSILNFGTSFGYTARAINSVGATGINMKIFEEGFESDKELNFTMFGAILGGVAGALVGAIFLQPGENYFLSSLAIGAGAASVVGIASSVYWARGTQRSIEETVLTAARVTDSYVGVLGKAFGPIEF